MATTDSNGILRYQDTDGAPTPPVVNTWLQSVSDAITQNRRAVYPVVANVAARTAYVSQEVSAGRPPSVMSPIFVYRSDAYLWQRVEVTTDGVSWVALENSRIIGVNTRGTSSGGIPSGSTEVGIYNAFPNLVTGMGNLKITYSGRIASPAAGSVLNLRVLAGNIEVASGQFRGDASGGAGQETLTFVGAAAVPPGIYNIDVRGRVVSGTGGSILVEGTKIIVEEYTA